MISLDVLKNAMSFVYPKVYKLSKIGEEFKEKLYYSVLDREFKIYKVEKRIPLNLYKMCSSRDPCCLNILEKNINKINMSCDRDLHWSVISRNPNCINLIKKYPERVIWNELTTNPSDEALEILKENPEKYNPSLLINNKNPNVYKLVELRFLEIIKKYKNIFTFPEYADVILKTQHLIDWDFFSLNPSPKAIDILYQNQDKINWKNLCKNTSAAKILRENLEKVDWDILARNEGEGVIEILEENIDKVDFDVLIPNKKAVSLLEKYYDRITNWNALSKNEDAIPIMAKKPELINWHDICSTKHGYKLVKERLDDEYVTDEVDVTSLFIYSEDVSDVGEFCISRFDEYNWEEVLEYLDHLNEDGDVDGKLAYQKINLVIDNIHMVPDYLKGRLFTFEYKKIIDYVTQNMNNIEWNLGAKVALSSNRLALNILIENPHLICWFSFTKKFFSVLFEVDIVSTDKYLTRLLTK